jgi:outer membrane protein
MILIPVALATATVAAAEPAPPPAAAIAPMSFTRAIEVALGRNPEMAIAREGVAGASERVDGAKARRLPTLSVAGNVNYWDKALEFPVAPGQALTIRDRLTATGSVTATQPISGLIVLSTLVGLEQEGVQVARAELDRSRLDVAYRAGEAYLRALQADAAASVATKSVAQFDAQLARARAMNEEGALGQVDVLRIEAATQEARQAALRADAGATTARRALALALGLDGRARVDIADDFPATPPAVRWSEDEAVRRALAARPELASARARVAQARLGRRAAKADYYPNVLAIATYQHNEGMGTLQPEDAWFVGATASWEIWNWGRVGSAVNAADHTARQAELAAGAAVDQVEFDVRRRWVDAGTAHATLEVAASGLRAAEEAYRIQSVRFHEGAATTTDVLDAETGVARARTASSVARYEYFISLVALARSIGEQPGAIQ